MCGSALPVSCSGGICKGYKIKTINWCNDGINQHHNQALCHSNNRAKWAMPPLSLCWSFHFFLWLFCICSTNKTAFVELPASCIGGSLLVSAACMQKFCLNNQPVQWWHWLIMQQVTSGACHSNDTASEQHHSSLCWSFHFSLRMFCNHFSNKKNMCSVTSKLQWRHLMEASQKQSISAMMTSFNDAASH